MSSPRSATSVLDSTRRPRTPGPTSVQRGLLSALVAFRWGAAGWMVALVVLTRGELDHPVGAMVLLGGPLGITIATTVLLRSDPAQLLRWPTVVAELGVGGVLAVADGWVFLPTSSTPAFGSAWVVGGVFAAGVAHGSPAGVIGGLWIGAARVAGSLVEFERGDLPWTGTRVLSLLSTTGLFVIAGALSGVVTTRLRRAEREVAVARARAEVAGTLHDGVLQTLAVVQRRSGDQELVRLARDQERDLRDFLAGLDDAPESVVAALRNETTRFQRRWNLRAELVITEVPDDIGSRRRDALVGAVAEALANVGKHASASGVTVFVDTEPDGAIFCSVGDDGVGFDRSRITGERGVGRSIIGRVESVGGRVEIETRPGAGTEVSIWIP